MNPNKAKSWFISTYLTLASGITAWSILQSLDGSRTLAWIGVLLTSAPLVLTIGTWMVFRSVARTRSNLPILHALAALGTGLAAWDAGLSTPLWLALASWAGLWAYTAWYSRLADRPSTTRLAAGSPLPGFRLTDTQGQVISSTELTHRPAVLIFYRGNWCPLCMAQVRELADRYRELESSGIRVALISPQPASHSRSLARRFEVGLEFYTDPDNAAARSLGIDHAHGLPAGMQVLGYDSDTVLPTVIITDDQGRILWTHETDNYRVRPEPDTFLAVLQEHGLRGESVSNAG